MFDTLLVFLLDYLKISRPKISHEKLPSMQRVNRIVLIFQYIGSVVEALRSSGMNINPQQEGTHTIYVPIPKYV